MNLLIRLEKISIRDFGNRFRRRPQFSDNIFRDHEKLRHFQIMMAACYRTYCTGASVRSFPNISDIEKFNWQMKNAKNVEKEVNKFLEKYNSEKVLELNSTIKKKRPTTVGLLKS